MDKISPEARSRNMSRIRGKNTEPEKYIRRLLYHAGFRYRIHYRELPGKPDVYLRKYRTVLFINGCFWHRHEGCRYATTPKSNREFWENKFTRNVQRDKDVYDKLQSEGYKVIVIWECTIRKMMKERDFETEILFSLIDEIKKDSLKHEKHQPVHL
ncbi:very short patch repair endonuclease [Proteiniclasticum sp. C24MP]|uniref:very short patch repair endonuclease n=1 Tax=Proteiniclasticum sp. C24MP TaxID=3374101 RepID=UPI0037547BD1